MEMLTDHEPLLGRASGAAPSGNCSRGPGLSKQQELVVSGSFGHV